MCGIVAIFSYRESAPPVDREELRTIRDCMTSRGPDGSGEWFSEDGRVAMGHRRLSIIDLSEAGAQPMRSQEGKLVVSFNGEIYNYKELRKELEAKGRIFRSHSDTEVLLHLYGEKGEAMVRDLRGMFAFALWDETKKALFLARDPYGIKPLYYADDGRTLRLASQVKALLASSKVSRVSEPAGIVGFFLTGSVPEPYTLYQDIRELPAGSTMRIDAKGVCKPRSYFSIANVFRQAIEGETSASLRARQSFLAGEAISGPRLLRFARNDEMARKSFVREALLDSIRHHFVSDVPVGIFLSAGVDSGSLVGLARDVGIKEVQTLTLAFKEFQGNQNDEAPLAENVARHYGTRHQTRILDKAEFQRELPKVFEVMDQPTIDGINTYFVSKAARESGLKVALSGLGGDELFGGYPSFREVPALVSALSLPSRIPFLANAFCHLFSAFRPLSSAVSPKYAGLLKYGGTYAGAYFLRRGLFMPWELGQVMDPSTVEEGLKRLSLISHLESAISQNSLSPFAQVACLESSFYLRNQLLRDADWAGMAHSLEIRTPFVDAFLLKKLAPVLATGKINKANLAESPSLPLCESMKRRPKTGFSLPMQNWLTPNERGHWSRAWARSVYKELAA